MALPFLAVPVLIKAGAAVLGALGVGGAISGAMDTKKASDRTKEAKDRHDLNLAKFEEQVKITEEHLEDLGKRQVAVAKDFDRFSDAFEKIQNRPTFEMCKCGVEVPEFNFAQIKASSVAANTLLGAIAGGASGVALGSAAAAGLSSAVMALGTASTGTAIVSLSGVAATNATLAVLGGGTIAAGGGGVAAGAAALGAATLGVGLLIGGVAFAWTGSKSVEKAEKAYDSMLQSQVAIEKCLSVHTTICSGAEKFHNAIMELHGVYYRYVARLELLVGQKTDWNTYDDDEQLCVQNTILIVSVLHKMINTPLLKPVESFQNVSVEKDASDIEVELNALVIDEAIDGSNKLIAQC